MRSFFLDTALLPDGWADDVLITCDETGIITTLTPGGPCPAGADRLRGAAIPGIPNLHSHAHQRAMAGAAERAGDGADSFWTWREAMYRAVQRLDPDQFEAVATQVYVEMLLAGYTTVGEFHYLHHDRDGAPFADPTEMSRRLIAAAATAGIRLVLLPVFYAAGGFGVAPTALQARFLHSPDGFARLMALLRGMESDTVTLGIAPHSLRAVPAQALAELVAAHPIGPIHIHVAEQRAEVEACLAFTGRRPVEWLLAHLPVDRRWCLIHATHLTPAERACIAASGATVGLCPTTEANLGDGIFPAAAFRGDGGRFGIGSDSNISVSWVEELRWLEYVQRLATGQRTVLAPPGGSCGRALIAAALDGGRAALHSGIGRLEIGALADFAILDRGTVGRGGDDVLDSTVFAGTRSVVRHVVVGGRTVVSDGRHPRAQATATRFASVVTEIAA